MKVRPRIRYRTIDDGGDPWGRSAGQEGKQRVAVVIYRGFEGFIVRWTDSCTGCLETEDGHPVGDYAYDAKAHCLVGAGCEECGYTGKRRRAEWVAFDVGAFLEFETRRELRRQRLLDHWRARRAA